jgi:hypothetical protein
LFIRTSRYYITAAVKTITAADYDAPAYAGASRAEKEIVTG